MKLFIKQIQFHLSKARRKTILFLNNILKIIEPALTEASEVRLWL
jgi:hypothetical protein